MRRGWCRSVRLRRLDDEDPRAPAWEVEAGEDVGLASFHVDRAEVDCPSVEAGLLEQLVERRH